jgi:DNA-binding MarR family transcriptional regulator
LADLADRIVHIARKLNARPHRDLGIVPLSPLDALVLRHVDRHPEVSSTQLATDLELQTSNASTVLRRLVDKGLLARHPDPDDRRAARFTLTGTARDSITRLRAEWSRALSDALPETLNPEAVLAVLDALEDSLE